MMIVFVQMHELRHIRQVLRRNCYLIKLVNCVQNKVLILRIPEEK